MGLLAEPKCHQTQRFGNFATSNEPTSRRKHCQMSYQTEYRDAYIPEPPDEAMWNAWLQEKLLMGEQRAATRRKIMKWASMGALIIAAVVYSYISAFNMPLYQSVTRLGIALGAIVVIFASFHGRLYSFTGLLGAIVLIFALSGNWSILLASVLPFTASLIWMSERAHRAAIRLPTLH